MGFVVLDPLSQSFILDTSNAKYPPLTVLGQGGVIFLLFNSLFFSDSSNCNGHSHCPCQHVVISNFQLESINSMTHGRS